MSTVRHHHVTVSAVFEPADASRDHLDHPTHQNLASTHAARLLADNHGVRFAQEIS